ncbi:MAG: site-specific DNA-methyltransferase [Ignavibacteriales bacterium]|nr:site-specific DNA-methyltransferase [Ignavibacteriales bacterium]MCB9218669.1 site-specific DNA-methyltransferase [Ignavibacteriales bacterium]MCB9259325.1 site-specific DNA-methyltransferase [Ignavibacteriales bacterium]
MKNFPLPRIDKDKRLKSYLEKFCRLKFGEIWEDPIGNHKIACCDSSDQNSILNLFNGEKAKLAVHDPPYNMIAFEKHRADKFVEWCKLWIETTDQILDKNSSLYIWLGADQKNHFEPFAEFILMMKETNFESKSFITMRNQRGYGTQKNWMAIRQELLYYVKGNPVFNTFAVYTDIPKAVKGYYKAINGNMTENLERSKSDKIRAGNVWIDIQQVFHLREENVNGCFVQKPIKALERIIEVSSNENDLVIDFFAHSGTTTLAAEKLKRRSISIDIEPIYCEIAIRRLERFRKTGKLGWQNSNPFEDEIIENKELTKYLKEKYKIEVK